MKKGLVGFCLVAVLVAVFSPVEFSFSLGENITETEISLKVSDAVAEVGNPREGYYQCMDTRRNVVQKSDLDYAVSEGMATKLESCPVAASHADICYDYGGLVLCFWYWY